MDETRKEGKKEFEPRFTSELFAWGESLMGVLIAFVIIFTFVVRLFGVDGMSMYPTLEDRSIMLVSNLGYHPEKSTAKCSTSRISPRRSTRSRAWATCPIRRPSRRDACS